MTYEIEQVQLAEQPAAVFRGQLTVPEIAAFLGSVFGEVMGVLAAQGRSAAGPPFGCFERTSRGFRVEAGFPTDAPVAAQGRVEASTLPAGSAVSVLHRGDFAAVAGAYQAAEEWLAEHDWESTGMPWESYLDEPDVPQPRTVVYWPARPR